jgi:hypothetical protein
MKSDWVAYLRTQKLWGLDDPLFPATKVAVGGDLRFVAAGLDRKHWSSAGPIRIIFKEAFASIGLPYFNPHSFRKTLALLGGQRCKTPEEYKAWSQNLGHEKVLHRQRMPSPRLWSPPPSSLIKRFASIASTLYVDYKLIEDRKLNKVENAAQAFLRDYPGVEAVFTRTQMENGMMPNTKLAKQVILAWHQQISGDIVIMNKPNWYLFAKPSTYASTHGSPWSYDTNVPLAMYGPNWIKPGKYGDSEVVDLARTIAFILNVRPPNGCEGRVLSEALN